jgi:D-alanyl-D-alanine carboxypeptidase
MFTAASILQLVEQRKISLDDPLVRVLPDPTLYQGLSVFDGKDYIDSITIRHLLNHTSGFADYFMGDDKNEITLHGDSTLRFTPRQLIRMAARMNKPKFRPGTSFGYSNVNYILLGMIIEKYSGLRYHAYVQRNILDPLGMKHTHFASVNSPAGRAPGYYNGKPTEMPATMAGAAGEIVSTLDDMQTFIAAWHQGRLFRQPATMTMLRSADFHDMGGGILYGLGVVKLAGLSLGHAGQTFGFSAYMDVLPNGRSFVFGIDDAAVSAWTPAIALSGLLGSRE